MLYSIQCSAFTTLCYSLTIELFLHPHVRNKFYKEQSFTCIDHLLKMCGGHFMSFLDCQQLIDDRKWGQRIMWSTISQTSPAGEKTGTLLFTFLYLHSLTCISIFIPGSSADTASDQRLCFGSAGVKTQRNMDTIKCHRNLFQAGQYFVPCSLQFKMALFHQAK